MSHEVITLSQNGKGLRDFTGTLWYEFHPGLLDLASKIAHRHVIAECSFCKRRLDQGFIRRDGTICCREFITISTKEDS
jgi:hypothetical protein